MTVWSFPRFGQLETVLRPAVCCVFSYRTHAVPAALKVRFVSLASQGGGGALLRSSEKNIFRLLHNAPAMMVKNKKHSKGPHESSWRDCEAQLATTGNNS